MPYNTNNTVPSSDLRDFYDNAQTLDDVVNSGSSEATTRTGKKVKTLTGIQEQVTQIGQSANQSAQSAAGSAAAAAQSAAEAAGSAAATGYVAPPFPDVWAPLSDDLKMIAGYPVNTKLISFSRASTATYIDKSGVLQTAVVNEPRFEKDGLLIEGQSTNLIANSNNLTGTGWSNEVVTLSVIAAAGPDGVSGATSVIPTTASGIPSVVSAFSPTSFVSGGNITSSFFVKPAGRSVVQIIWGGGANGISSACANFDLSTLQTGGNVTGSVSLIPLANGWFRCSATTVITGNLTDSGLLNVGLVVITSVTDSRRPISTGNGVDGVLVFGAQLENSNSTSSYIPTTGAAATRADDIPRIDPINGGFDNVTISCEISRNWTASGVPNTAPRIVSTRGATPLNAWEIAFNATGLMVNSFGGQSNSSSLVPGFIDGQIVTSIKSPAGLTTVIPSGKVVGSQITAPGCVSPIYLGNNKEASRPLFGHIRNLRIWHRALSDNQIKGLR